MWRRLVAVAAASVAVWLVALGAAAWYLDRAVTEEYRTGARTTTDGDSIGLPLGALGLALGALLLALNVAFALVLAWRRRRANRGLASRPAA